MTRTNSRRLWLITASIAAFAASPALASEGYQSVNAITGPTQSSSGDRGFESVNAVTGPLSDLPSSLVSRSDDYSSPNALVGSEQVPTAFVEVGESEGFDWGDAVIGALVGTALMLLALGGARLVGQRRRIMEPST